MDVRPTHFLTFGPDNDEHILTAQLSILTTFYLSIRALKVSIHHNLERSVKKKKTDTCPVLLHTMSSTGHSVNPSGASHRLYVRAKHVSFQRGKRNSNPNISLLKLEGVDTTEAAKYETSGYMDVRFNRLIVVDSFYLGKKVVYIYRAKKEIRGSKIRCIWGKIRRTHGKLPQPRQNM